MVSIASARKRLPAPASVNSSAICSGVWVVSFSCAANSSVLPVGRTATAALEPARSPRRQGAPRRLDFRTRGTARAGAIVPPDRGRPRGGARASRRRAARGVSERPTRAGAQPGVLRGAGRTARNPHVLHAHLPPHLPRDRDLHHG